VEAGVDLSAATLFTEVAPWSSIVQRAGRCNRDGRVEGAAVHWDSPEGELPYRTDDIEATRLQLEALSGMTLTTAELAGLTVPERGYDEDLVLRRADLVRLFDTTPDLMGNDLDVSPFIRAGGDDLDALVYWRDLGNDVGHEEGPSRDELCPVPVGELREWVKRQAKGARPPAHRLEHLDRHHHRWVPADLRDLRPGQVLLLDSRCGGYTSATGWSPRSSLL
jgi:CRISPR-associated endonuclease/helicase Cas3